MGIKCTASFIQSHSTTYWGTPFGQLQGAFWHRPCAHLCHVQAWRFKSSPAQFHSAIPEKNWRISSRKFYVWHTNFVLSSTVSWQLGGLCHVCHPWHSMREKWIPQKSTSYLSQSSSDSLICDGLYNCRNGTHNTSFQRWTYEEYWKVSYPPTIGVAGQWPKISISQYPYHFIRQIRDPKISNKKNIEMARHVLRKTLLDFRIQSICRRKWVLVWAGSAVQQENSKWPIRQPPTRDI